VGHQLLAYVFDVNLLEDNVDTVKKYTETLIGASNEVGPKTNEEKTRYMLLFHHQNSGQNWDMKIVNRLNENVSQFKYLGITVTNHNMIREEYEKTKFW
jgi:hypothetical protein